MFMKTKKKISFSFSVLVFASFFAVACSNSELVPVEGESLVSVENNFWGSFTPAFSTDSVSIPAWGLKTSAECAGMLPPSGFYNALTIPVPSAQYGDTVRCTFDGSEPTPRTPGFLLPYVVEKNTAVRCAEFVDDEIMCKSEGTFFMHETVRMPVVAISVDPVSMFDSVIGYYSKGVDSCTDQCKNANFWQDRELPVHVEFFENGSSSEASSWHIDAGLSIMGNASRNNKKRSLAIKMKERYQDGRLKYPLFKTRPENNKFKGFNLRNGGNRYGYDYIEDAALSSLLEGSGVDYQRSRQVVVFFNGEYFGIYDLRERLNEHFVETNYKIDSKIVDMVKQWRETVTVNGGSKDAYLDLLDFVHKNNFAKEDAYLKVSTMMDVGNYADYMAAEIYFHNGDWPNNNVRAWATPHHPFKFVVFDLDHGFGYDRPASGFDANNHNMFSWIKRGGAPRCNGKRCFAEIYNKLVKNPDFKRLFINHSSVMLDYYLTYDRLVKAVDDMVSSIPESEIKRDMRKYPRNGHEFDKTGASLKNFAQGRSEKVREEYREEFKLGKDISVTIAAQGNGDVLLDGMKLPENVYTGRFFEGNDMLLSAVPKGGSVFVEWTDGCKENPRLVSPKDGAKYEAVFR